MGCSLLDPTGCATSIAKSVAGDAFSAIATDFAKAADSVTNWMWGQMSSATAVHLGGQGFDLDLAIVGTIALTVAVGLFMVQIITSVLRRDGHGLARAGKGLLVAFLGGGAAIAVTNLLLQATDALSAGVVQAAMGTTLSGMGGKLLAANAILTMQNPSVMLLAAIATIAAVMIVWFALMVRKVLIVVSAVFAPLAFAGSLADISVSWTRKWIEIMVALIASKLILVIIFIVGWGVLLSHVGQSGTGVGQSVTQVVSGILILGVAGLAPWMALKLVQFSGDHFHQLHAMSGAAAGGAAVAVSAPQKAASIGSSASRLAGAGASSGGGGGGAGPEPREEREEPEER
jgi:type IV secretion system protein TrbL